MGRTRAIVHRRAAAYGLGAGRATVTLCLSCRKDMSGVEEQWQERGFWKGVAWLEADDLSRHQKLQSHHVSLKPSSVHSPGQGAQGWPLRGPGAFLLPPPPRTGSQEAPCQPSFTTSSVSTLTKSPSPCCCPVSGWQGGSHGFRLVPMTLLGPHWSASLRGLLDTASTCLSVGTPGRLLGDSLSLQCACVLGTHSMTSG